MRSRVFIAASLLVFGALNYLVWQKEQVLAGGRTVILALAPRDPRSLMQGDYMTMTYAISADVPTDAPDTGRLVLRLDNRGIGTFQRVYTDGAPITPDEALLRYRRRQWRVLISAEDYFFQEGQAQKFAEARYGELKVSPAGEAILVGLCNAEAQRIR